MAKLVKGLGGGGGGGGGEILRSECPETESNFGQNGHEGAPVDPRDFECLKGVVPEVERKVPEVEN